MKKVKLEWHKLTIPQKIQRGREIVARLTGNTSFSTPIPSLSIIIASINALEIAHENAFDGGRSLKALMHAKEKILDDQIAQLEAYVEAVSAGDEQKIMSAGLLARKISSHGRRSASVKCGVNPDEVIVTAALTTDSRSIMHEFHYCKDPMPSESMHNEPNANSWLPLDISSKATLVVSHMPLGIRLWFRERAILTRGRKTEWHVLGSIVLPQI